MNCRVNLGIHEHSYNIMNFWVRRQKLEEG